MGDPHSLVRRRDAAGDPSDSERITVHFVDAGGTERRVEAVRGTSLMEAALRISLPGIDAKCRGNCACVTCHVHVDPRWREATGAVSPMEESMLDFAEDVDARSRLACQVRLDHACDGIVVHVPAEQRVLGF